MVLTGILCQGAKSRDYSTKECGPQYLMVLAVSEHLPLDQIQITEMQ